LKRFGVTYLLLTGLLFFSSALPERVAAQETFFQFDWQPPEEVSLEGMTGDEKIIYISDRWRFKNGDDMRWASPDYDDTGWDIISTNLTSGDLSFVEWEGVGWFRKQIRVDEKLRGKAVALVVDRHLGASEIYLNGEKVYELGRFSSRPDHFKAYSGNELPLLVFSHDEIQTLAVRFANHNEVETSRLFGQNGFRFLLADWHTYQSQRLESVYDWTRVSMFYAGVLLTFFVIHFLLFLFYPQARQNLYFSLFSGGLFLITYLIFRLEMANYTFDTIFFMRFTLFFEIIVLVFAVRFIHSINQRHNTLYSNGILIAGFIMAFIIYLYPVEMTRLRELLLVFFVIELLRTLYFMFRERKGGAWIVGAGMLLFVSGLIISLLINFQVLEGDVKIINMSGSALLILSMSVFLSRDFSVTRKNLQNKLVEVQELSRKSLEQERISKEREIEKRLLEAEHERKTAELEEARALQLSMLPQKVPAIPGVQIAFYMDTATEVGGDYYDYSVGPDQSLVLALGDATGHGMKAGIMVAAAKSYFHTMVHDTDLLGLQSRISAGLRNLNMRMMYMGMSLLHIRENRADIAIAGMPPLLYYSKRENRVERITLKGLPLGGKARYPYQTHTLEIGNGDIFLLMSDGLTELFSQKKEMLGLERIEDLLYHSNGYSSAEIIQQIQQLAERWTGGMAPHDDITLMAVKITGDET
jgi:serine phosphatase RsbU (regulator of sigma subunit)